MAQTKYCRHCERYNTHHPAALGKHEKHCWANPNADGSKNTDFSCIACGERLITKSQLADHRREFHTQIVLQRCQHCRREWMSTDIRRAIHEERCHQNRDSSYSHQCPHCRRRFPSDEKMNSHALACRGGALEQALLFSPTDDSAPDNRGIYSIAAPSGKVYVGMTARMGFKARREEHLKQLRQQKHHCIGLQRAYSKYGEDDLVFTPLEQYSPVDNEEIANLECHLLIRERELWDEYYNNGIVLYNSRPTGTGSVYHSEESREKRRITYYLSNNSTCPIWNLICSVCGERYTTAKQSQHTCTREDCVNKTPRRTHVQRSPRMRPPLHLCSGEACCNFVPLGAKYCGPSCSYTPCQSPICCNHVPSDRRSGPYCNQACKEGRGELNPLVLEEMHHSRGMSTHNIGKLLGYSAVAVQICMKKHGIDRISNRRIRIVPSPAELKRLYVGEKRSVRYLRKKYGAGDDTVKRWLIEAGIPLRE